MSERVIGIDLGTTNSVVAALDNGEPIVIPNHEGARTTPSVVCYTESGERFVGQQARRQAVINPTRTFYGVKRLVGRRYNSDIVKKMMNWATYPIVESPNGDAWVAVDGLPLSPQEISAQILSSLRSTAEDFFGEKIRQAVITVPAYFNDAQRQATRDAGRIADLDVRRIINEPTAAALAYGYKHNDSGQVAVFDLGGGTFDISIVHIQAGVFEVLATSGNNALGGDDFDQMILDYLVDQFREETGFDVSTDKMAVQRLREAAENAKCELSSMSEATINLPFLAVDDSGPRHFNATLSRSALNELVFELARGVHGPCQTAMKDAGLTKKDLDEVLLVGGMTRMPLIREQVDDIFGSLPTRSVKPDEVVAMGAAIQSGILEGEVKETILLDVTPFSLGVRVVGDRFSVLLGRNTAIPVQATKVFTTIEDNQEFVNITVLQGEEDIASRNKLLANFTLTDLPREPLGTPRIQVTFDIDCNGIVNVSAQDLKSGKSQSVEINDSCGLSTSEFTEAANRVQT